MKKILLLTLLTFGFTQNPPNWDCDGDGMLDNYTDYQNNGKFWCATEVTDANRYVSGKWGECSNNCPLMERK